MGIKIMIYFDMNFRIISFFYHSNFQHPIDAETNQLTVLLIKYNQTIDSIPKKNFINFITQMQGQYEAILS